MARGKQGLDHGKKCTATVWRVVGIAVPARVVRVLSRLYEVFDPVRHLKILETDDREHIRESDTSHRGIISGSSHGSEPVGHGRQRYVIGVAGRFPLVASAGMVQAWWRYHQGAIGLQVEPWARVKFAQGAMERKIMMGAFAPTEGHCGLGEWPVG